MQGDVSDVAPAEIAGLSLFKLGAWIETLAPEGDSHVSQKLQKQLQIGAAFVFIGVAGTALIFFIVLRIRDHTDPNHTVRAKYSNSYASCVQLGGDQYACGVKVLQACEKDSWWQQPSRVLPA